MRKVISGDQVCVIAGKDKGKIGRVIKFLNQRGSCGVGALVVVSNVNIKKYINKNQSGKKLESKEFPINASNVALVDSRSKSNSRVGFKFVGGIKKRYFKKSGELLD